MRRAGRRRRRHVLHRRVRAGDDGGRHRRGAGPESAVIPFPITKKHKACHREIRRRLARSRHGWPRERVSSGSGSRTTRSASPSASRRCAGSWVTASSPWNSTTSAGQSLTGTPKNAHSVLTDHLDDREGTPTRAALDQVMRFLAHACTSRSRHPRQPAAERRRRSSASGRGPPVPVITSVRRPTHGSRVVLGLVLVVLMAGGGLVAGIVGPTGPQVVLPDSPAQQAGETESHYIEQTSLSEVPGRLVTPVAAVDAAGSPCPTRLRSSPHCVRRTGGR